MTTHTKIKKSFDCLAFKDEAQARVVKEIQGLSRAEQLEYFHRHAETGPFADFWKRVRARSRQGKAGNK